MSNFQRFGVIGAGAWGTALAQALCRAGRDVLLWAREPEVTEQINEHHANRTFLPDVNLYSTLRATSALEDLCHSDAVLLVVPVQHMRATCAMMAGFCSDCALPLILCSKGIEIGTLKFPSQIVKESLPQSQIAILSGPSFAREVALDCPTALTLACEDKELCAALGQAISSPAFRPYTSEDVLGAQIGGAVKNVMAIATGIATGCDMGENARAALITRGLAEIMRLGEALGAKKETLMGLSGLGDLTLTCSSTQSRNMSLGFALGKGQELTDILAARNSVAEGVPTTAAVVALAEKVGVEMPLAKAVYAILHDHAKVRDVIAALLDRPLKMERH